jgi:hypothetical protein
MISSFLRRFRFRFGLKALLLAVTLVCVAMGWFAMQLKWKRDRADAREWMRTSSSFCVGSTCRDAHAPLTLWLLGERSEALIWKIEDDLDSDEGTRLDDLKRLFPEASFEVVPPDQKRRVLEQKQSHLTVP